MSKKVVDPWFDRAGNRCSYREDGSLRVETMPGGISLTKQEFRDDCDINLIYQKYAKTGLMNNVTTKMPMQGDFSNITDFQSAYEIVVTAEDAFMNLSSKVRTRFNNDPGQFLDFIFDTANRDEAIKLGLIDIVDKKNPPASQEGEGAAPTQLPT